MYEEAASADYALISRERTQQLEVLMHLLGNSNQPVVLCGPKGIGKTYLINTLIERKKHAWRHCLLSASSNLRFDGLLQKMAQVLGIDNSQPHDFKQGIGQIHKLVVFIDDAGWLVPGLLASMMAFALENPMLRLVFVLTPDELFIKTRTDPSIDDCHVIDMPPLTEKECGDFLRYLAAKSWPKLAVSVVTDPLIADLYRESQGIPGRIVERLPHYPTANSHDYAPWLLILAVAALVAIALCVQWLSGSGYL